MEAGELNLDGLKIMLIEDEQLTVDLLKMVLRKLGAEVTIVAKSEVEARSTIESKEVDVAIVDVYLGFNKDGIAIAKDFYENYNIPCISLTTSRDLSVVNSLIDAGIYSIVQKPFLELDLYIAIKIAINKHRQLLKSKSQS